MNERSICCSLLANYLLESMDEAVNPCEDFYEFTCGTWLKNVRIPNDGKFCLFVII